MGRTRRIDKVCAAVKNEGRGGLLSLCNSEDSLGIRFAKLYRMKTLLKAGILGLLPWIASPMAVAQEPETQKSVERLEFKKIELKLGGAEVREKKQALPTISAMQPQAGAAVEIRRFDQNRFQEGSVDALWSSRGTRNSQTIPSRFSLESSYRYGFNTNPGRGSNASLYGLGGLKAGVDGPTHAVGFELGGGVLLKNQDNMTMRLGPFVEYLASVDAGDGRKAAPATGSGAQLCVLYDLERGQYFKITGEWLSRRILDSEYERRATKIGVGLELVCREVTLGIEANQNSADSRSTGETQSLEKSIFGRSDIRLKLGLNLGVFGRGSSGK